MPILENYLILEYGINSSLKRPYLNVTCTDSVSITIKVDELASHSGYV